MLGFLRDQIASQLELVLKTAVTPMVAYLRKISFGMALLLLSLTVYALSLTGFAAAIFLAFAQLPHAMAAVWTAMIFLGVGLFMSLIAALLMRPPR